MSNEVRLPFLSQSASVPHYLHLCASASLRDTLSAPRRSDAEKKKRSVVPVADAADPTGRAHRQCPWKEEAIQLIKVI